MVLCKAKDVGVGGSYRRRLALAVVSFVLILALPVAGGRWAGLPAAVWHEFPPRQVYVHHARFHWVAFLGLAWAQLVLLAPIVWRGGRHNRGASHGTVGIAGAEGRPPGLLPVWGWVGIGWTLAAWAVAWTRLAAFAPIQHHTYVLVWTGYIVTVLALTQRRAGTCRLTRQPAALAGLALLSAAFWWGFEFLNRSTQNWFYQHIATFTPSAYVAWATLSFMTVLPAVLGTHDWLATYPRLTAGLENWIRIRTLRPRLAGAGFALAGGAGLFLLPVWTNALFPLLWLAPLALLCGLLAAAGEATLFDDWGRGDWRTIVRLSLSAVICGWFWEMWNMYSLARWVYEVPYVGGFRVFEMPLLGYAGYGPFGWECAAVAMVFGLWQPPPDSAGHGQGKRGVP